MFSDEERFEMHAAAKHIHDHTKTIMMLIEGKDINTKMTRYDLICTWRKVRDELDSITMGFGNYPYNDMLIKEEA